MKKFLSILLALAVGFTFTFGSAMSAFAAPSDANKTAINTEMVSANETVQTIYNNALAALAKEYKDSTGKYIIESAQAATVLEAIYKDIVAYNTNNAAHLVKSGSDEDDYSKYFYTVTKTGLLTILTNVIKGTATEIETNIDVDGGGNDNIALNGDGSNVPDALVAAYAAQFAVDQAELNSQVISTKIDMYSTNIQPEKIIATYYKDSRNTTVEVEKATTYNEAAKNIVNAVSEEITKLSVAGFSELSAIKAEMDKLTELAKNISVNEDTGIVTLEGAGAFVKNLKNKDEEDLDNSVTDSRKASLKATLASQIATAKSSSPYTGLAADVKASVNEWITAYQTALNWLIDNEEVNALTGTFGITGDGTTADVKVTVYDNTEVVLYDYDESAFNNSLVKNVAEAAKAIADVENVKAEKNNDGTAKYSASTVEATLKGWLKTQYKAFNTVNKYVRETVYTKASYVTAAYKAYAKNLINVNVKEPNTSGNATDYYMYDSVSYYDAEWKDVTAAVDAVKAAIDAATTEEEIENAVETFGETVGKINDTTDINNLYKTNGILKKTFDAGIKDLKAYGEYLNGLKTGDAVLVFDPDPTDVNTVSASAIDSSATEMIEYFAAKGVRTSDELTAAMAEYKISMGTAPSIADIKVAVAAVEAQIKALPAVGAITLADKDAIATAYKAYNDLNSNYRYLVSNIGTLTAAKTAVQTAENKAIAIAYSALPTTTAVTVADKAAVEAVADMIDVFDKTEMYTTDSTYSVDNWLAKIQKLELTALETAVDKVPTNLTKITLDDKATIEAARAAYDAYLENYTEVLEEEDITTLSTYEKTIADAEAVLAKLIEAEKWTDNDAKAYANDLANLKVNGKKLSNGKVKFTLGEKTTSKASTFTDNGYTVKYSFYKAESKNGTYSLMKTKDTAEIIPTKGVKGKTYYFKVVLKVYDASGALVAKTYLGQADYGYAKWTAKTVK